MYVLASKSGILTGRRLAKELGLEFHTNVDKIRDDSEVIIRYGNAQESRKITEDTDCNSREAILRASAKHKLSEYLEESNIVSPVYFPYRPGMIVPKELGRRFLARHRQHRAGQDIGITNRGEKIPPDTRYLVPLYEHIIREYRVHVCFGEVVKVMRKYPIDENAHSIIKTAAFGWQYKRSALTKVQCSRTMTETAIKAAEILGLSFCGIDMAWSGIEKGLGKWIIWEVNSAPSLNTDSLNLYIKLFKKNLPERLDAFRKPKTNNGGNKSAN